MAAAGPLFTIKSRQPFASSHARSTRMRPLVSGLVDDQILIVINDLLTQITAVFVTIGGASDGSGTRTKTTGNYRG
jgi:hypothetical protein